MKKVDHNSESTGSIKPLARGWRGFRNRLKGWWMQWPYCNFGESDLDRYYRIEYWRHHQIRRQDVADLFTRR